jgi:hypothetical protein
MGIEGIERPPCRFQVHKVQAVEVHDDVLQSLLQILQRYGTYMHC